jgi:hypothetical protein
VLIKVTDHQDRGPSGVQSRPVYINPDYIVAMEAWGPKYKVFVGRSLEYVVSADDAERLDEGAKKPPPSAP